MHLHFAKQSRYEVVPKPVADKIAERDAACVIQNTSQDNAVDDEDDTYAAFEVPDDLMW